jgi:hypothetical protein
MKRFMEGLFPYGRAETLGEVVRYQLLIAFLLSYGVYWAWEWAFFIRQIPGVLVPQGLAREVDLSFLVGSPLALANAAVITLCAAGSFWPSAARLCLPMLVLLLHIQYVARHCLGKVAHGSQYVGLGLLAAAIAVCCMPTPSAQRRFTLGTTQLLMGAGYVCAALSKLVARGSAWPDGHHLWLWIGETSVDQLSEFGAVHHNALQALCLEHLWLANTVLTLGLLTELCGFLLWLPASRTVITCLLIGVHLGIYFSLGILFEAYTLQLALVGLPLAALIDRGLTRFPHLPSLG